MAKHTTPIDYKKVTITTLKTKYATILLGMSVCAAFLLIIASTYLNYPNKSSRVNPKKNPKSILGTEKKISPTLKVSPKAPRGEIGEGLMTDKVTVTGEVYTVAAGETLSMIAIKVYGDMNAWIKIAQANNITNPDNVEEGTKLKIPKP